MNARDAVALIADAVPQSGGGAWADFGAGDGTFTRALITILGTDSRIYAVDLDATALATIDHWPKAARSRVTTVVADLSRPFELPGLGNALLDGALVANALHFMRDTREVLSRLASLVKPGGRIVIVEYDRREAGRWAPYPIPVTALPALAAAAGLSEPTITARRPSNYAGELYVAAADRL